MVNIVDSGQLASDADFDRHIFEKLYKTLSQHQTRCQ